MEAPFLTLMHFCYSGAGSGRTGFIVDACRIHMNDYFLCWAIFLRRNDFTIRDFPFLNSLSDHKLIHMLYGIYDCNVTILLGANRIRKWHWNPFQLCFDAEERKFVNNKELWRNNAQSYSWFVLTIFVSGKTCTILFWLFFVHILHHLLSKNHFGRPSNNQFYFKLSMTL